MNRRHGMRGRLQLTMVLTLLGVLLAGGCLAASGDAARGAQLFSGGTTMANGGAPCLACHGFSTAGFGAAGAASFGPDLSRMYEDYGDEAVTEILASLPFPSMIPIYSKRPLTEQEVADIGAFFAAAETGALPGPGTLIATVIAAVIIFLGLVGLLGRRRLRAVRQPMVEQSRNRGGNQV